MHRGRFIFRVMCCLGALTACLGLTSRAAAQTTGACCVRAADGTISCVVVTRDACFLQHGFYRGDNTTCSSTTCAPPPPPTTGSCCLASGGCIVTTSAECTEHHGTYNGDN